MGFIPSTPDVEVGFLRSASLPNAFLKCELNKTDKSLKNVSWGGYFGTLTESHPPVVGKYSRSGMTVIVCLNHQPDVSYFFQYRQGGIAINVDSLKSASKAFAELATPVELRTKEQM